MGRVESAPVDTTAFKAGELDLVLSFEDAARVFLDMGCEVDSEFELEWIWKTQ